MKIISWNVNGYRACAKKGFLDWLKKSKADIICLQEIRSEIDQVDEELKKPLGYHTVWNSAEKKGYSGTLCLSKTEPLKVTKGFGIPEFDREGRCIELEFDDFIIYNNYFPNGGRDLKRVEYKLEYYDHLLKRIKKQHKKNKNVIVTGDWNTCHKEIDLARPKPNVKNTGFLPEERVWIDKYIASDLSDTFRDEFPDKEGAYSWWSNRGGARDNNVGWRLDYFLVSSFAGKRVSKNIIHSDVKMSDHCPVEITWK
jgi:exodeoxyribonuclease III